MRRLWVLMLLPFSACDSSVSCELVGKLVGTFSGDASGDLVIEVVQSKDDPSMADLTVTLTTPDLEAYGAAVVTCDGGEFDLTLETADTSSLGDFAGSVAAKGGDGSWSFSSGESGTWEAAAE